MELRFIKPGPGTLLSPADEPTDVAIKRLKIGEILRGDFKKQRNPAFHRKAFALFNFLFEHFEPTLTTNTKWENAEPCKSFERFRKDLVILAGFHETSYRIDGSIRVEAQSISFGSMDETEFSELYQRIIDVGLKYILPNYSKEELENTIDQLLSFA